MHSISYKFLSLSVAISVTSLSVLADTYTKVRTTVNDNKTTSIVKKIDHDYPQFSNTGEWIVVMKQSPLLLESSARNLRQISSDVSALSPNERHQLKLQFQTYERDIFTKQDSVIETVFSKEKIKKRFSRTLNAVTVSATDEEINLLRQNKSVRGVFKNTKVRKLLSESTELVGAPLAWSRKDKNGETLTGKGIKVAVVDSGVDYSHPDLGGCFGSGCKVFGGYDFVDKDNDPMDVDGHGTHVAGIVASNGTLRGVAPDAEILAVRVLGDDGMGDMSDIVAGIEYAVDPDGDPLTDDGVDVINLSLGGMGDHNSPGSLAADAAVEAGVVVVAAAGNDGNYNDIANHSPASARLAITVGSTEKYGGLSTFSSKGPLSVDNHIKPELVAPGGDINSLGMAHDQAILSGTSMASPHVAGSAALLLQSNPSFNPLDVKALLMSSATSIGIDPYAQGYGLINVNNAIDHNVVSLTPPIDFSNVTTELNGTTLDVSVKLKNLSDTADKAYLSFDGQWPDGVELLIQDSELTLDANGNVSTKVSLRITDADAIPFLESTPGAYYGSILVSPENSPAFNIPISFKRNHVLTISHNSPGGVDLSIDNNDGASLYWGPIGPNESRKIELAPGKLYFTVDYLGLEASDLSHINGFAENITQKAVIYGYEAFALDITESKEIEFSVKNLRTPIGLGNSLNSNSVASNTYTAFTRLKQQFSTDSGVEHSYDAQSISNTNLNEGQKNEYLVVGSVDSKFDINYEITERFDNKSGVDTLFHLSKDVNDTLTPTFYSLNNPKHELLVKAPEGSEDIYDFFVTAFSSPWYQEVPTSGVQSNQVLFSRIEGGSDLPIQFSLTEADSSILEVERIQSSPNVNFNSDNIVLNGTDLSEYVFEPLNPLFVGSLEVFHNDVYLFGDVPTLMSINGSQGTYIDKKYSLLCDGVTLSQGSLEDNGIEQIITGCDQQAELELSITNKVGNKSKSTHILHEFDGSYSFINGIDVAIVDANSFIVPTTHIETNEVSLVFSSPNDEQNVTEVLWKLNKDENWHRVSIESIQQGKYTQRASLPSFYTEESNIDVKVVHSGTNSVTTHTFYEVLTVGVDLSSNKDDVDKDGIVNAHDLDNDNDGIPDQWEKLNGLNPLDNSDALLDFDNDGLSNYQEYQRGLDPQDDDSDGDGKVDGVDSSPAGVQAIAGGKLIELIDLNNDGNNEFANVVLDNGALNIHILDGARHILNTRYSYALEFDRDSFTVELAQTDTSDNLELIVYGLRADEQGNGRPRAVSIDVESGNVNTVYNWPSILENPILVVLDDLNGDDVPEIGISGVHKELKRPQMIVRDGESGDAVSKFSYPSIFNNTRYYSFSDANNDGVKDVAMMGTLDRNGKIQIKVSDALDGSIVHGYTFASNWEQTSFHKLSDLNFDGVEDWGLLGRNKLDKRWQLIQKSATDPRGIIQIHAWPEDMENIQFKVLPDMTGDGISELAMYGVRVTANRIQLIIKDGANRSSTIGSYGWANVFTDYNFNVMNDVTGDNVPDVVFAGKLDNQRWQTFIVNAATNERVFREVSSPDMTDILQTTTSSDINYDGKNDLIIWGENVKGELISESYVLR
jgi:subtilisin family serine protease